MATSITTGRSKRIAVITAVLMLVGGGIAFAYWTTTGSGTGSATSGTGGTITVNQTSTITELNPGAPAQTLSGTFTNNTESTYQVSSLTATVASVTTTPAGGDCEPDDYVIAGTATFGDGGAVPIGTGVGSWTGLTIAFVDEAAEDQNACKGATVSISYTAS
jgi:hypothetical protein